RKNGTLNLPGDFEFLLDGKKALLVGVSAKGREIPEAANKDEEANRLDVTSSDNAEVHQVRVNRKKTENCQSRKDYLEFSRQRLPSRERERINEQYRAVGNDHEMVRNFHAMLADV